MTDLTQLPTGAPRDDRVRGAAMDQPRPAPTRPRVVLVVDPAPLGRPGVLAILEELGASPARLDGEPVDGSGSPLEGALRTLGDRLTHLLASGEPGPAASSAAFEDLVLEGRALLSDQLLRSGPPVVLAHPELPAHLGAWLRVLGGTIPTAVVVVARSLQSVLVAAGSGPNRGGPRLAQVLAHYDRTLRSVLPALEGAAVFVDLEPGLEATSETPGKGRAEALAAFLGLDPSGPVVPGGVGAISREQDQDQDQDQDGRQTAPPEATTVDRSTVPPALEALDRLLSDAAGAHDSFSCPSLGPESPWTAAVLELERDLDQVVGGLLWATRQIEPIVRAAPRPEPAERRPETRRDDDEIGAPTESVEPGEGGPYPLNASEDRIAYHRWLHARRLPVRLSEPPRRKAVTRGRLSRRHRPLLSVLVPVWRTPLWALERCVGSVLAQDFADWELCLCDDASGDADLSGYLRSLGHLDRRIKVTALDQNGGISAATNGALALARGQYVGFLDHDDELTPNALGLVAAAIAAEPEADVLYSDEDKIDASGERFDPLFKPEWSPDLLLSFAYLAHLMVVRRQLVLDLEGLRAAFDGSQDWDLSLRATERARRIVHIPEVLYHWRTLPTSTSSGAAAKPWAYEAGVRVIEDALARGGGGEVTQVEGFPGRYHVRRAVASRPLVSIIVPFRDEPALLATCATSLRQAPGYDRVELVLVDNGSELPETAELLERLDADPDVRIVEAPGPFNWAAINNAAALQATGDVLLFANNDIEARVPRWLDALLGHALRPEVGAVGARLLYPDGAIQHAGVVVGLGGIAGHVLRGLPGEHPGYNSMAIQTRNCSVVTGACMMARREVFDGVGGFDEALPVAFNDVDFCLKLREGGYLVVYEPLAELVHHESRSRGHTDDLVEGRRIVERWGSVIAAGDPYMNVHLSHWRYWCPLSNAQEDDRWKTYLETSVSTPESSSST